MCAQPRPLPPITKAHTRYRQSSTAIHARKQRGSVGLSGSSRCSRCACLRSRHMSAFAASYSVAHDAVFNCVFFCFKSLAASACVSACMQRPKCSGFGEQGRRPRDRTPKPKLQSICGRSVLQLFQGASAPHNHAPGNATRGQRYPADQLWGTGGA